MLSIPRGQLRGFPEWRDVRKFWRIANETKIQLDIQEIEARGIQSYFNAALVQVQQRYTNIDCGVQRRELGNLYGIQNSFSCLYCLCPP